MERKEMMQEEQDKGLYLPSEVDGMTQAMDREAEERSAEKEQAVEDEVWLVEGSEAEPEEGDEQEEQEGREERGEREERERETRARFARGRYSGALGVARAARRLKGGARRGTVEEDGAEDERERACEGEENGMERGYEGKGKGKASTALWRTRARERERARTQVGASGVLIPTGWTLSASGSQT